MKNYYLTTDVFSTIEKKCYSIDDNCKRAIGIRKVFRFKICKIPLKKLVVDDWQDESMGKLVKIKDSPNFKFINNNISSYQKKCQFDHSHTIEKFEKLLDKLHHEPYNNKNLIVIDSYNYVMDGAHRLSFLLSKHNESYRVLVLKLWLKPYTVFPKRLSIFISKFIIQKKNKLHFLKQHSSREIINILLLYFSLFL